MQHGSDSRSAHRTRNLFKNALLRLLETESFAYISVKDIVETAEFNRTTFYNHYVDKFALLDDVTQDLLDEFGAAFQTSFQKYHPKSKILMDKKDIIIFDFVYRNRYSLSIFKQTDILPMISQKYSQTMQDKLMDIWSPQADTAENRLQTYTKIFTYGLMGTISGWISEDFSTSPETVTQDFVDFYNFKIENINK
jgi:AcrR family transcriptional regulator